MMGDFIYSGRSIGVFKIFFTSDVMNFDFARDITLFNIILIVLMSAVFVKTYTG